MSAKCSERSKKHKQMLSEAMKKPGVAATMDVLARWQRLDTTLRRAQPKPTVKIVSAIGTSG